LAGRPGRCWSPGPCRRYHNRSCCSADRNHGAWRQVGIWIGDSLGPSTCSARLTAGLNSWNNPSGWPSIANRDAIDDHPDKIWPPRTEVIRIDTSDGQRLGGLILLVKELVWLLFTRVRL
jgi:hypothetical protein